jgi:hypothetical protein
VSQCKSNGIVVNTLLDLKIPESPMNPVAAAQHRLGGASAGKKSPPKGRLAQLTDVSPSLSRLSEKLKAPITKRRSAYA